MRSDRPPVDTFTGLARRVAAAALSSEFAPAVRRPLDLAGENVGARADYLAVELERLGGRASATVYMSSDHDYREPRLDAEGNAWSSQTVRFDVSWPSYGTDSLARAAARAELVSDAVRLALRLEAEFGGRHDYVLATAAERAAQQTRAAAAAAQRAVEQRVAETAVGLRRGGALTGISVDAPAGNYDVAVGKKRFSVVVGDSKYMAIARLDDEAKS